MKRTAPSSPSLSPTLLPPPSKVSSINEPTSIQLRGLPEEILMISCSFLMHDDLLDLRLTSRQFHDVAEKCFKDLFRSEWKSNTSFSPINGSWCAQYFQWCLDFSQLKHALPKVTWCVENSADRKLRALIDVPYPHKKRMMRLLNAPTTLRMEDSPLHYACAIGCVDVVQVILSYSRESVNKLIQGECRGVSALWTPLHYAISFAHPEIVKILIENGANARLADRGVVDIPFFAKLCGNKPEILNILPNT